ncbi:hypothetical protein PISMIDRAFT_687200 [Pisolithus microcarpus 441]|uniref:Uncharacterized protein n=1 Tax=Pisolithus microcarpus 441 TaxID=765257 RepID=A0A0C9XT83_9AGAM|nr:hypothetical protein BKA83DRAFT_687200 [Pisolithus microcarpus]KIK15505.1 hypothetical protein PISMIDRAFT_687200 [Pisolithus microcarpus 441]
MQRGVPPAFGTIKLRRVEALELMHASPSHLTGMVHTSTSLLMKWGGAKLYGMGQYITTRSTCFC